MRPEDCAEMEGTLREYDWLMAVLYPGTYNKEHIVLLRV